MRALALLLLLGLASPALAAADPPAAAPTPTPAPVGAEMTLAEYQAVFRQRLMAADADHDGKLSQAEFATALDALREGRAQRGGGDRPEGAGGRRDPSRLFGMLDANGDGFIDPAEIDAMSARRFARMDANGDGKVTAAEREAARGQWRGRTGGQGRGWGGSVGAWGQGADDQSGGGSGGQPDD